MKILLMLLGAPVWLSLYLSLLAVLISAVASFWAIFGSFAGVAVGTLVLGVRYFIGGQLAVGGAMLGICIASAGLAILSFIGARAVTKACVGFAKSVTLGMLSAFKNNQGEFYNVD